jgi:hypothetical protein
MCNYLLDQLKENLGKFVAEEKQMKAIFSSKLLEPLATKLDADKESPNVRQSYLTSLLIRMIKLGDQITKEFGKDNPIGFEMSPSLHKAIKTVDIIEQGAAFTKLMEKIYFNALLESEDRNLIKHLGKKYSTDK